MNPVHHRPVLFQIVGQWGSCGSNPRFRPNPTEKATDLGFVVFDSMRFIRNYDIGSWIEQPFLDVDNVILSQVLGTQYGSKLTVAD